MSKQGRGKGGRYGHTQGGQARKTGSGFTAAKYSTLRAGKDVIAFARPGASVSVQLYVEAVEDFQRQKRSARSFVLIVSKGLEAEDFESYEVPFEVVAEMLPNALLVESGRPHWQFNFEKKTRALVAADGSHTEMKKIEKRPANRRR